MSCDSRLPIDVFERILIERQIYRETCVITSLVRVIEITLDMYLAKQSQAIPCLRILIEYITNQQLFLLDRESKQ
jgi:hypothetical protein